MRRVGGPLLGMLLLFTPAMAQDADRLELKGVVGTAGVTQCYAVISFREKCLHT